MPLEGAALRPPPQTIQFLALRNQQGSTDPEDASTPLPNFFVDLSGVWGTWDTSPICVSLWGLRV